jgi:hypothetical protein
MYSTEDVEPAKTAQIHTKDAIHGWHCYLSTTTSKAAKLVAKQSSRESNKCLLQCNNPAEDNINPENGNRANSRI